MFALGIDPGAKNTGWCMLRIEPRGSVIYMEGGSGSIDEIRPSLTWCLSQATTIGIETVWGFSQKTGKSLLMTERNTGRILEWIDVCARRSVADAIKLTTARQTRKRYLGKAFGGKVAFPLIVELAEVLVERFPAGLPKYKLDHISDALLVALYAADYDLPAVPPSCDKEAS